MKKWGLALMILIAAFGWWQRPKAAVVTEPVPIEENQGGVVESETHPLAIERLRQGEYPSSEMEIEQTLEPGSNYSRYIASYKSEGLKIYGLLTVPEGEEPEGGWPAIIFNHGYIPPEQYRSTERYLAYTDGFSQAGYVLFRPDYRGHGNSEGEARGAYWDNGYTIDVLNSLVSVKRLPYVNAGKIGMWGHSLGGFLTLRAMVIDPSIKAGVIWGGVVGDYGEMFTDWWAKRPPRPTSTSAEGQRRVSTRRMIEEMGNNQALIDEISANAFVGDISGPVQIHHARGDETVPYVLSERLAEDLEAAGKEYEFYLYEGDNHNLSANFVTAMRRSVEFFDRWLKEAN
jgi:dipeptidyl aminopeptidase/acylaminoacyl peptidase